ncbi:hypothetical protein [Streptomyces sp. RFCAC02]|uniref:hypothetical protein n=1 Tax=Streptomyces sp. RFCAC02 TaxID=2499143 RepID=UPI0010220225|nr:hypothetical protein [Streptomyces sp. RFCAC02]
MENLRRAAAGLAAVTVVTAAGLLTACDVERVVDCARLAVSITGSVDDIQQAVNDNDPDALDAAATELDGSIEELHGIDDEDVQALGDSLAEAAETVRVDAQEGVEVDLGPLSDVAGQLTDVCSG